MLKNLLITSAIVGLTLNEVSAMEQQALVPSDIYTKLPYHMHPESRQNWATSHKAAAEGVARYKELAQEPKGFTHMKVMLPSMQEIKRALMGKELILVQLFEGVSSYDLEINAIHWVGIGLPNASIENIHLVQINLANFLPDCVSFEVQDIKSNCKLEFLRYLENSAQVADLESLQLIAPKEAIEKATFLFEKDKYQIKVNFSLNGIMQELIPEDAKIALVCKTNPIITM